MSGGRVRAASPAKINLSLAVGAPRPDGYHPLATVYLAVGLYDEVEVVRADGSSSLTVLGEGVDVSAVPTGPENLVLRAVALLGRHHDRDLPVAVQLRKRIPVAGGLAGGSTDAAATLVGVDAVYDLRTPRAELLELAGRLGSDVPFCLLGGAASGTGRGELVAPVRVSGELWWVVVPDRSGLSTPSVYAELDRLTGDRPVPEPTLPETLLPALAAGDATLVGRSLHNDLGPAALSLRPDLADVLDAGRRGGDRVPGALGALVSGSGPTTLFLCADAGHAERLAGHLRDVRKLSGTSGPVVVRAPAPGARRVLAPEPGRAFGVVSR